MTLPFRGPLGAVIIAAGSGVRFGGAPKVLRDLGGYSVLEHSLRSFAAEATADQMVVVLSEQTLDEGASIVASMRLPDVSLCLGGPTRGASVREGISRLDLNIEMVAVHDAARPFVTGDLIRRVVAAARSTGAAAPGVSVTDTVVSVDPSGIVDTTLDRARLRALQTPQVACRAWLEHVLGLSDAATDEAGLLFANGYPVQIVEGDTRNIKLTRSTDLLVAQAMLSEIAGGR